MQKTHVFFLAIAASFIFLCGCVEHAGYSAGLKALEKGDVKHCNGLKEQTEVKECYYTFADGKNDPNYCLQAPDPSACVSDYASKRQLMSPCDVLKDPVQKYGCVARVAGDQTGRSIEEIIADFKTRGTSKKCLGQCEKTESTCKLNCDMNKKVLEPYESNGMIVHPVDTAWVECTNSCTGGYKICREDCLSANEGKDPNFN